MDKSNEERIKQLEEQIYILGYELRQMQQRVEKLEGVSETPPFGSTKPVYYVPLGATKSDAGGSPIPEIDPRSIHWVRMGTQTYPTDKPEDI